MNAALACHQLSDPLEERVLVLAPTGRDGLLVEETLARAGIHAELCASMAELCEKAQAGAGSLFVAEEALTADGIGELSRLIDRQPTWSDLPVIVSTSIGATTEARVRNLAAIGVAANVVILERPVRVLTMVVTVQSALRARRRQYQMRNLTNQIEHERAKLEALIMQLPVAICILEGPDFRLTVANQSLPPAGPRPQVVPARPADRRGLPALRDLGAPSTSRRRSTRPARRATSPSSRSP